ncbi:WS/DGAT/MGAT family O-acyltransferase [Parahaliea aestuarii]|uniref:diacylglycerol O-acyltransferase n=1 Tax=Parahaliea aestuarii TaxID=1852021 RepID=A0A5C9A787_9GAMM|nr:wax ester/triacylglycerol synthase family O-acyltransferase [Parahaliea aestuarii]TXS95081.1 wax ester/triacylglycerol synthase family O-acyltransferase [Parahaliea aestuarii]
MNERVNASDASWLMMESRERPMHVATLLIYTLPTNAGDNYMHDLVAALRDSTDFADPFNRRLQNPALRVLSPPTWIRDYDLDMEFHVRHHALPRPGGERELGMLISRLHSNPMDLARPLWEYHVIENLQDNSFAVYFKMHHSMVDGIAGIRMLQRSMSTSPEDVDTPALWSAHAPSAGMKLKPHRSVFHTLRSLPGTVASFANVGRGLVKLLRASQQADDHVVLPFQTPVSILNHRIQGQRRFATQLYQFDRIKRLSKLAECTVNDIILALCAGALRTFLKELGALPGRPLTAGIPVSLRTADDQGAGSAVSFIIADLATNVADPMRRLQAIATSTRGAKAVLQGLPRDSIEKFSMALMTPYGLQMIAGLEGRTRPVFNVTVSNVPGPQEPLYFRGARLEAMYPVSAVTHGQALNITCYSYAGTMTFGFSGCRDTLPHMQKLAIYTGQALEELEAIYLPRANRTAAASGAKKTAATRPRPKAASSGSGTASSTHKKAN